MHSDPKKLIRILNTDSTDSRIILCNKESQVMNCITTKESQVMYCITTKESQVMYCITKKQKHSVGHLRYCTVQCTVVFTLLYKVVKKTF